MIFDRLIGQKIEYVDEGYSEMALLRYQLRFGREIYREDKKKFVFGVLLLKQILQLAIKE